MFLGEELLAPGHPPAGGPPLVGSPQLLLQYVRSYPPYRGPSSIRNPRTLHAVVTGTHLSRIIIIIIIVRVLQCVRLHSGMYIPRHSGLFLWLTSKPYLLPRSRIFGTILCCSIRYDMVLI